MNRGLTPWNKRKRRKRRRLEKIYESVQCISNCCRPGDGDVVYLVLEVLRTSGKKFRACKKYQEMVLNSPFSPSVVLNLFNIFSRGYQAEAIHIDRLYSTDLHDAHVQTTWSTIPRLVTSDVAKEWNISDVKDFRGFRRFRLFRLTSCK